MKNLNDMLDHVVDQKTFLDFVQALIQDKIDDRLQENQANGSNGWCNTSIEGYLGSALAWANDSNFGSEQCPAIINNQWYQFAVFLYCGKIYE